MTDKEIINLGLAKSLGLGGVFDGMTKNERIKQLFNMKPNTPTTTPTSYGAHPNSQPASKQP